jgi:hypothetical protein
MLSNKSIKTAAAFFMSSAGILLGVDKLRLGPFTFFDITMFLGVLCVLVAFLLVAIPKPQLLLVCALAAGLVLFSAGLSLAATARAETLWFGMKLVYVFGLWLPCFVSYGYWLGLDPSLFRATGVGVAILGVSAALQFLFPSVLPMSQEYWGRYTGLTTNPNQLGTISAAGIPLLMGLWRSENGAWKYVAALGIPAAIVAITLSASRTGMIGACIGILAWLLLTLKNRNDRKGGIGSVGVLVTMIAVFLLAKPGALALDRLARFFDAGVDATTVASRLKGMQVAWDSLLASPVFGNGYGAQIEGRDGVVHNAALLFAHQGGAMGLLAYLLVVVLGMVMLVRLIKNLPSLTENSRRLGQGVAGAMLVILCVMQVSPTLTATETWWFWGLGIAFSVATGNGVVSRGWLWQTALL